MYAQTSYRAKAKVSRIQRDHQPSSVMVWWGVLWNGATVILFCTQRVKMTAKIDEEIVLQPVVKSLHNILFKGQHWIFQQDSAHKSKCCQKWLANIFAFIRAKDWTFGGPDLNPLNYELWDILEQNACRKRHPNSESLTRSIIEEAVKIPLGRIRKSIARCPGCLQLCIDNEGSHFELILVHSNCILIFFATAKQFFQELLRFKILTVFITKLNSSLVMWDFDTIVAWCFVQYSRQKEGWKRKKLSTERQILLTYQNLWWWKQLKEILKYQLEIKSRYHRAHP